LTGPATLADGEALTVVCPVFRRLAVPTPSPGRSWTRRREGPSWPSRRD